MSKIVTTCFGGQQLKNHINATFPNSATRASNVENDVIYFERSTVPSYTLDVMYRLPLSKICGGVCTGSMNVSIVPSRSGLLFGLSDSRKAVLVQAEPTTGEYELLYGSDLYSTIEPTYDGWQPQSSSPIVSEVINYALKFDGNKFGSCSSSWSLSNIDSTAHWYQNISDAFNTTHPDYLGESGNGFGLDISSSIDLLFVATKAEFQYGITAACIHSDSIYQASIHTPVEMPVICGLNLPSSQPTSQPTSPTSIPTSAPTARRLLLYHDNTVLYPDILSTFSLLLCILFGILTMWHFCISDRESNRDTHILDAEEHAKSFYRRVVLNRKDYYMRTSWVIVWMNKLREYHKLINLFSFSGVGGRTSLLVKFTIIIFELLSFMTASTLFYLTIFPDTGECELIKGVRADERCGALTNVLNMPRCYWKHQDFTCHYLPPMTSYYWGSSGGSTEMTNMTSSDSSSRDYDSRIYPHHLRQQHQHFEYYFYDLFSNFHSVVYILICCWVVITGARMLSMTFERLLRERVVHSYLSSHKYARTVYSKKKYTNMDDARDDDKTGIDEDGDDGFGLGSGGTDIKSNKTGAIKSVSDNRGRTGGKKGVNDEDASGVFIVWLGCQRYICKPIGALMGLLSYCFYHCMCCCCLFVDAEAEERERDKHLNDFTIVSNTPNNDDQLGDVPTSQEEQIHIGMGGGVSWKKQVDLHEEKKKSVKAAEEAVAKRDALRLAQVRKPFIQFDAPLSSKGPTESVKGSPNKSNADLVGLYPKGSLKRINTMNSSLSAIAAQYDNENDKEDQANMRRKNFSAKINTTITTDQGTSQAPGETAPSETSSSPTTKSLKAKYQGNNKYNHFVDYRFNLGLAGIVDNANETATKEKERKEKFRKERQRKQDEDKFGLNTSMTVMEMVRSEYTARYIAAAIVSRLSIFARRYRDWFVEECKGLYDSMITRQIELFNEKEANTTEKHKNRFWNMGDKDDNEDWENVDDGNGGTTVVNKTRGGAISFQSIFRMRDKRRNEEAVERKRNKNNTFYSVLNEYEDLMMQAKELVTRPRLTEESATTVTYCKRMLGLDDDGTLINESISMNNAHNSWYCCLCAFCMCCFSNSCAAMMTSSGGCFTQYYPAISGSLGHRANYTYDNLENHFTETGSRSSVPIAPSVIAATAPSKGSILRNIQFSRCDSKRIFHRLYGLNNLLKNILLLENFLLCEYPITRYAGGRGCYLFGLDSIPPKVVSLYEYLLWCALVLGVMFIGQCLWIYYYITMVTYHSNIMDVTVIAGASYVIYQAILSPLFIYLFNVVVGQALELELSYLHMQIRNRARTVFERKYSFFGRDLYHGTGTQGSKSVHDHNLSKTNKSSRDDLHNICCITDHYNPTCRVAKAYSSLTSQGGRVGFGSMGKGGADVGLVMFRLVLELNDYDINRNMFYIMNRKNTGGVVGDAAAASSIDNNKKKMRRGKKVGPSPKELQLLETYTPDAVDKQQKKKEDEEAALGAEEGAKEEQEQEASSQYDGNRGVSWYNECMSYLLTPPPPLIATTYMYYNALVDQTTEELKNDVNNQRIASERAKRLNHPSKRGWKRKKRHSAGMGAGRAPVDLMAIQEGENEVDDEDEEIGMSREGEVGDAYAAALEEEGLQMNCLTAMRSYLGLAWIGVCTFFLFLYHVFFYSLMFPLGHLITWATFIGNNTYYGCVIALNSCSIITSFLTFTSFANKARGKLSGPSFFACCCPGLSGMSTSWVFGEGNIEWEYTYERIQHSLALVIARVCLSSSLLPLTGMSDVAAVSTFAGVAFGTMMLMWYIMLGQQQENKTPNDPSPVLYVFQQCIVIGLPTLVAIFLARCEYRRRTYNKAIKDEEKMLADKEGSKVGASLSKRTDVISSYDNIYQRIVDYMIKLEDLQGSTGADALLSRELLLEHMNKDIFGDLLDPNENNRKDGRRGGIVNSLDFSSTNNTSSLNFKAAGMTSPLRQFGTAAASVLPSSLTSGGDAVVKKGGKQGRKEQYVSNLEQSKKDMMMALSMSKGGGEGYGNLEDGDDDHEEHSMGISGLSLGNYDKDEVESEKEPDLPEVNVLDFSSSGKHISSSRKELTALKEKENEEMASRQLRRGDGDGTRNSQFLLKPIPPAKMRKKDKQEADIDAFMTQLSVLSKATVREYLKTHVVPASPLSSKEQEVGLSPSPMSSPKMKHHNRMKKSSSEI